MRVMLLPCYDDDETTGTRTRDENGMTHGIRHQQAGGISHIPTRTFV